MIFSFIPAGLLGMCGVLALFRSTRVIAAYLASLVTCSIALAVVFGAAGLVGAWLLYPYPDGGDGQGLTAGLWALAAAAVGGIAGLVVGAAVAHRLTRGRPLF
ncbi:hypothetical protein [Brevundimonas sp. LjRoot202]|uniref:hypothetical protein n=1 Tax=Brevundimonas sp. LjRoot202 TaxID=3342281 RepID=UPI003ECDDA8A